MNIKEKVAQEQLEKWNRMWADVRRKSRQDTAFLIAILVTSVIIASLQGC